MSPEGRRRGDLPSGLSLFLYKMGGAGYRVLSVVPLWLWAHQETRRPPQAEVAPAAPARPIV